MTNTKIQLFVGTLARIDDGFPADAELTNLFLSMVAIDSFGDSDPYGWITDNLVECLDDIDGCGHRSPEFSKIVTKLKKQKD
jgi:hypothetical protein